MKSVLDPLNIKQQSWLKHPALVRLMTAFYPTGDVRIVGGAVRKALRQETVGEIDLATPLTPQEVTDVLTSAGIKVVPTGIEHGTVTAVVDRKGYEITTLRHDVETDGRHAKVAFTDDWQADAARRDFTINALYLDGDGNLYDYFDGVRDLEAGRIQFIGHAEDRIREDVLRILRFFRFYAVVGRGDADPVALEACQKLAPLMKNLSMERIRQEILKLLEAPNPAPAWQLMLDNGVLATILPEAKNIGRFRTLLLLEKRYNQEPHAMLRLAALLPSDKNSSLQTASRLKLSNHERETLVALTIIPEELQGKLDLMPFRRTLYHHGVVNTIAATLILVAESGDEALRNNLEPLFEAASLWDNPIFPLKGEDLMGAGLKQGPQLGKLLKQLELWWVDRDFRPTRAECLIEMQRLIKS